MPENRLELSDLRQRVCDAIRLMRIAIRWKPGKDISHLRTRIDYGHLPTKATLAAYEGIITQIIHDDTAEVYAYMWPNNVYPTIVGEYQGQRWLVMFGLNGIMETAFPPDDPVTYLADVRFQLLGSMQELMK